LNGDAPEWSYLLGKWPYIKPRFGIVMRNLKEEDGSWASIPFGNSMSWVLGRSALQHNDRARSNFDARGRELGPYRGSWRVAVTLHLEPRSTPHGHKEELG
jgi:hypothetical protein